MKSIALSYVSYAISFIFFHRSSYVQILGAEEQQAQPSPQEASGCFMIQQTGQALCPTFPAEAADIIAALKTRGQDELLNETLQLANAMKKAEEKIGSPACTALDREIDLTTFVQKYKNWDAVTTNVPSHILLLQASLVA
ncbi:hypothetical protein HAX54_018684 [Datura stramonium]|uniref:Uncharacterized protein n=1 Tax=Datura stramonium TaxID=4076 RepID=A0ABS8UQ21_DATST|nr:hypothetical protein [Datura stramonium]